MANWHNFRKNDAKFQEGTYSNQKIVVEKFAVFFSFAFCLVSCFVNLKKICCCEHVQNALKKLIKNKKNTVAKRVKSLRGQLFQNNQSKYVTKNNNRAKFYLKS